MKNFFYLLTAALLIYSTSFSQITWNLQSSGTFENLNAIYMVDIYNHYAVGNNGKVLKTTNSGQTWTTKSFPTSGHNNCVYFEDANTGFVGNQNAVIYKTTNGGDNWEANGGSSVYPIVSICMPSTSVGYCSDHYSNIQKSTDNGQTWWTIRTTPGWDAKIYFLNEYRGWSVDTYGYVNITTNGGLNWSSTRISTDTLSSVYFLTSTIGYACGDSGRVFKSTNGGYNWTLLNNSYTYKLKSIYAQNLNSIYVCANNGRVLYSNNGGTSWSSSYVGANNLNNFDFLTGSLIGGMVGDLGTVYRTYNMGNSCIATSQISTAYPFYTSYMDARTDYLYLASELTANGVIPGQILQIGFTFNNADTITLHGFNVKMQNTSQTSLTGFVNSGWSVVYSGDFNIHGTGLRFINFNLPQFSWNGTSNLLIEICYDNSYSTANSYIQSSPAPGMTYHSHTNLPTGNGCTGITSGSAQTYRANICFAIQPVSGINTGINNIPDKYFLSQNYPNPFNPVTKIMFGIQQSGFVKLNIYDILGKEVNSLVNNHLQAGEYIIDFNGSELPSGTYFYKLEANNFTETKKMILLK